MKLLRGTALSCLAVLTLCAAAQGAPPPNPPDRIVCYEIYKPVCGTKYGRRLTYTNRCFAERDGAHDISEGECGRQK